MKGTLRKLGFVLFLLAIVEIACRGYFAYRTQTSFLWPDLEAYFYPEMCALRNQEQAIRRDDEAFDVLLLGASVLHPDFGTIAVDLEKELAALLKRPVRISNVAKPGFTSRDSLNQYAALDRHRFDLVILYDVINETRFNNCPPDVFRDDYRHVSWYERLDALKGYPETPAIVSRYALYFMYTKIREQWSPLGRMGVRSLHDPWLQYGGEIRTAAPFRANILRIMEIAQERGDSLMLMSYATYLPQGYDLDKPFPEQPKEILDYHQGGHAMIDLCGKARNVVKGVQTHNDVLYELAAAHKDVLFVDQARKMPSEGRYFSDVCHLSPLGCKAWVSNTIETLRESSLPEHGIIARQD